MSVGRFVYSWCIHVVLEACSQVHWSQARMLFWCISFPFTLYITLASESLRWYSGIHLILFGPLNTELLWIEKLIFLRLPVLCVCAHWSFLKCCISMSSGSRICLLLTKLQGFPNHPIGSVTNIPLSKAFSASHERVSVFRNRKLTVVVKEDLVSFSCL